VVGKDGQQKKNEGNRMSARNTEARILQILLIIAAIAGTIWLAGELTDKVGGITERLEQRGL
jgi:hypothetical protein